MKAIAEPELKPFLTIKEFAEFVGKPYATVWEWINEGRIMTTYKKRKKKKIHRVAADAAMEAKKRLEDGLWI